MLKPQEFVKDKKVLVKAGEESILFWAQRYFQDQVLGSPQKTQEAKKRDLEKFLSFYSEAVGHVLVSGWTPAVTKHFQQTLLRVSSPATGKRYSETTVNRVLATVRHFAKWLHRQHPLSAGDPCLGVRDVQIDEPDWNGLTPKQIMRLKSACEQRLRACVRKNQNPLMEAAVFYVLLHTGLRESEVVALNIGQYHHRGLHNVMRQKNKRVTKKVPLPQEGRAALDAYLQTRPQAKSEEPMFLAYTGERLHTQDVQRLCQRLVRQANAVLPEHEQFHFTPHMLRHTFLKKVADTYGVHFAQQLSGNVSIREVFRYVKPSQDEIAQKVEELF